MTPITRSRDHTTMPTPVGLRSSRSELRPRRRPSIELITEGVVAGYLHEISGRNHHHALASGGLPRRAAHS